MPRYAPVRRNPPKDPSLPRGFTPIRDLLDEKLAYGKPVNVVGVVRDCRLPRSTKGSDWKCTLTLCDDSAKDDKDGIDLNIFRPEDEMPKVGPGDVVIALMVKYQSYGNFPNLLTQHRTDIHVYEAERLPACRSSGSAKGALKKSLRKTNRELDIHENEYVIWLFNKIDDGIIPDQQEFSTRAAQSLNVKNKECLLKDVKEHEFADLVVEVVKEPWDFGDKMEVWVSDYTEHDLFFNMTFKEPTLSAADAHSPWRGPYGKKSIQLTCWEPHADFIRHEVHAGDWVRVRNVQIKKGHSGDNLEGFLREDHMYPHRVCVDRLDTEVRESMDQWLLDAIRRKRDYEKDRKHSSETSKKRRAEELPRKENARSKRQRKRENKFKAVEEQKAKQEASLRLNDLIKCENQDRTLEPLSTIIEPVLYHTTINHAPTTIELPFICAKYRTYARVVDFHPASLEDFAVRRRVAKFEVLSDNEDSSSLSGSSRSSEDSRSLRGYTWEWRFALKLEEPSSESGPPTRAAAKKPAAAVWVFVDNLDGQLLTSLDAGDLNSSAADGPARLAKLRERMFTLWGNLEERKSRVEDRRRQHLQRPLQAPPVDPDDAENNDIATTGAAGGGDGDGDEDDEGGHGPGSSQLSNKPFECCIRQYGVEVEANEGEDDAGEGQKWEKAFQLFGTKIAID